MPVSPADGERYAAEVLKVVDDLEAHLFGLIRESLASGADSPDWALRKLAELQRLRAAAARGTRAALVALETAVRDVTLMAYGAGAALALGDLDALGRPVSPATAGAVAVADGLAAATLARFGPLETVIPRLLAAAYSEAVGAGAAEVLSGAATRLQASQHVLDRLLSGGIRGFTDAAGREWSLASYTEMAVRTVTGQAAVAGHVDQLRAAGMDLVSVSTSPRPCPLCTPWEGKVLSLSGVVGGVIVPDAATGAPTRVSVAGTLDDAHAAGLQHPNCRHRLAAYLPGVSEPEHPQPDPDGYAAGQRQRAMERTIREWKRREQLALTPEAAAKARRKTREWQTALRDHVDAHGLKRLRYREQVGTPDAPLAR